MSCSLQSRVFRTLWSNISAKLKPNSKILKPVYQGPRWVRIMEKNGGWKSRDTLLLRRSGRLQWQNHHISFRVSKKNSFCALYCIISITGCLYLNIFSIFFIQIYISKSSFLSGCQSAWCIQKKPSGTTPFPQDSGVMLFSVPMLTLNYPVVPFQSLCWHLIISKDSGFMLFQSLCFTLNYQVMLFQFFYVDTYSN